MESKFTSFSTYNYTLNNPILYIDIDGKDIFIPTTRDLNLYKNSEYFKLSRRGGITPQNVNFVIKDLQKMTNDKLRKTVVRNERGRIIGYKIEIESYGTEHKGKDYKKGTERIKNLIENKEKVSISKSMKGNSTIPLGDGDSLILYNESDVNDGGILNDDGTKGRPPFIGLGHEIGHAENYKDTGLEPKSPIEKEEYVDPDSGKPFKNGLPTDELVARDKDNEIRGEHLGENHDGVVVKKRAKVFGKKINHK